MCGVVCGDEGGALRYRTLQKIEQGPIDFESELNTSSFKSLHYNLLSFLVLLPDCLFWCKNMF